MHQARFLRGSGDGRRVALCFALFLLLLLYPVMGMLWHHSYPAFSPEIAIVLAAAIVVALMLSLLLFNTRTIVRNLAISVFVTIAFMIHFNLLFAGLSVVLLAGLLLGLLLKERYAGFVLAVLVALIVGSWLDSRVNPATKLTVLQPSPAPEGKGPIVHILVDGFMAPGGLPGEGSSEKLRDEVVSFFGKYGFELHTRAYSHYNSTLDSMTRAFNFRNDEASLFQRATALREDLVFRDNVWFEVLAGAGHAIHVYQSESLDFCDVAAVREIHCNVFPIPNLKTVNREVGDISVRVEVLLRTLASQSAILTEVLRDARILDTWGVSIHDERLLPKLAGDLLARPGDAFFAHLLIPHSPFVLSENCSIDYQGESSTRWPYVAGGGANDSDSQGKRYEKYNAQSRCAMKLLGGLFDAMRSNRLFDDATIIVNGDHGSSAHAYDPSIYNMNRLTQRDLLDAFSTLFAVKWPGGKHAVVSEVESLNVLMAKTARRIAGNTTSELRIAVDSETEPFVYLTGDEPLSRVYVNIYESPVQGRRHQ